MFGNFFIGLLAIYVCYYCMVFFLDVRRINKGSEDEAVGNEVNISQAVANYKAVDAAAIIRNSINVVPEDKTDKNSKSINSTDSDEPDMDRDYADEERDETADDGSLADGETADDNLPFSLGNSEPEAADENSSGSINQEVKLKIDRPEDDGFAPVEHSSGMSVVQLSQLFEEANLEESFFKGILSA